MHRAAVLVAVVAASLAPAAAADTIVPFRTPSKNISCAYEAISGHGSVLRCDIRSGVKPLPPKPRSCEFDWGAGYEMTLRGRPHVTCVSDTVYDPRARVLAYGTTWRKGGFACRSSASGLRCTNAAGRGFFLSRARSYAF